MSNHQTGNSARKPFLTRIALRSRRVLKRCLTVPAALAVVGALVVLPTTALSQAQAQTCANPVACENQLTGTPQSTWDVSEASAARPSRVSRTRSVSTWATSINFKIQSPATSYTIDIYRMGYYGGDGARLDHQLTPNISVSQNQPACNTNTVDRPGRLRQLGRVSHLELSPRPPYPVCTSRASTGPTAAPTRTRSRSW